MSPSKFPLRALLAHCMALIALAMLPAQPAWAVNNCDAQQSGIGGTGSAVEHGGIGGTGDLAQGSGMGGTGAVAQDSGTGIVGIITGFASICVNGMEVHYDSNTPLEINGQPASANDLAVGQLVYAEATGTGDEVVARKISVRYAVSGPVTHANNGNGQIRVMGQTVQLTGQTINSMGGVQPGDIVRVSGLRKQDGVVMAVRVERAAAQSEVSVSGPVSRTGKREFNISGLRISPESGKMPEGLATGREVYVHGQLKDGQLKAEKIEVAPALPFGGREQRLVLQGYVRASRESGKLRVGETQMEISPQAMTSGKPAPDQLVRVSARMTSDKRVVVEHIKPVRSYFERKEPHNIKREGEQSAKNAKDKDTGSRQAENRHGETSKSADHDLRTQRENTGRSGKPEGSSHRPHKKEVERHERSERMERSELIERAERIERTEIPERVERIERIETPERVEQIERVERPESH